MQVQAGKIGKKGVKIKATATLIVDGKSKSISAKAVTMRVENGMLQGTLTFKAPVNVMAFEMASDGLFTLKNDRLEMVGVKVDNSSGARRHIAVGGNLPNGSMKFMVTLDPAPKLDAGYVILESALPNGITVTMSKNKKMDAGKAASLKYKKDKNSGEYALTGLADPKKPNLSGLKLSYTPKTGLFKGSFKLHATNEAVTQAGKSPKLKKYTVNVIGFIVDGKGIGQASIKKPVSGPWSVTMEP